MISRLKDPFSGLSHLLGAMLSLVALVILIFDALPSRSHSYILSAIVFGISLILLYSSSAIYHLLKISAHASTILRKLDHMMIYVLIAGTYTPICLITLKGTFGKVLLIFIWSFALVGMILKLVWFSAPRWLSTFFYLLMGWIAVLAFAPMTRTLPAAGMFWLILGGVMYSIGGVIYGLKWPLRNSKYFGFHEIFHIFVLLGSLCHFFLILKYVI